MTALQYEPTATVLEPVRERSARIWFGLVGLCMAQFVVMFDSMAALAAITTAQLDVGVSADTGDPLITAYGAVLAGLLWFGGRIADRLGLDRALIIGGLGFAGLSLLGALSVNGGTWFAARAGQAVFAALMLPAVLALITVLCPGHRVRAWVLTAYCAVTMAGMAVGYSYGSTLLPTSPDSWQITLFLAAAGTVVSMLLIVPVLVGFRRAGTPGPIGAAALVPGVVAVVAGFALAGENGWTAPVTMVALGVAAVLVAAAYFVARRSANWPGPAPRPTRRGVALGVVVVQAGAWGLIFPLYQFQYVTLEGIDTGAFEMAPYIASVIVFAVPALWWARRAGPRLPIVIGLLWTGACLGVLSRLQTTADYATEALPYLALVGAGVMAAFVASTLYALGGASEDQAGRFGARWSGLIQLGIVTGTVVIGTVKKETAERFADGRAPVDPDLLEHAYGNALVTASVLSVLGAVLVFLVLRPTAPAAVPARVAARRPAPEIRTEQPLPVPAGVPPRGTVPVAACAIVGSVRTAGGVPLPGVVLTLVDPAGREMGRTTTDPGGNYRMDTPDGGDFMMVCAGTAAFDPSAGLVTVNSGIRRHDVVLRGGSAIFGHVRAGTRALPGATVTITDGDGSVHAAVETGLDGHFDIDGLVAGHYTLSAVTPGLAPVAQTVELPGGRVHRDLVLADLAVGNGHRPGHPLGGVVRSARSDRGVPWALVTLVDPAGNSLMSTRTGPDGEFRFDRVPVGPYRLTTTIYHQESVSVEFAGPDTEDTVIMIDRDGEWTEAEAEELLS